MGLLSFILAIFFIGPTTSFAPPLTPRSTTDNPPPANQEVATPSEPPAEDSDVEVRRPIEEKVKRATLPAAHTPAKQGQTTGPSWIAQRTIVEDYCGWGWVRKDDQEWNKGRWIAIEASPGLCPIPHTFLPRPEDDKDQKYRFFGEFAPYRADEPQAHMWVDVFILKGFMSLGPAKEEIRRPPPSQASSGVNRFADRAPNLLRP